MKDITYALLVMHYCYYVVIYDIYYLSLKILLKDDKVTIVQEEL